MKKLNGLMFATAILLVGCSEEENEAFQSNTEITTEVAAEEKDQLDEILEEAAADEDNFSTYGTYGNSTPEELMQTFFNGVIEKDIMVVGNLYSGDEGTTEEIMEYFEEEFKNYTHDDLTFEIYETENGITPADVMVDGSSVLYVEMESTEIGYMIKDL